MNNMKYCKEITLESLAKEWGFRPILPFGGPYYLRTKKDGSTYRPDNPIILTDEDLDDSYIVQ